MRSWRAAIAIAVALACSTTASAQTPTRQDPNKAPPAEVDSGTSPPRRWLVPGPPAPPKEPGWFHLDSLSGYLELEASYEQQRRRRQTAEPGRWFGFQRRELRQTNVDWRFEEKLGFELSGDIVNPHVFAFDGSLVFGLDQSHFRETIDGRTDIDTDTGVLLEYDLRGRFLQSGALNGEVYARRSDNRIPRRFLPSLDEERTLYGLNLSLRSEVIPMRFTIEREHVDRDGGYDPYDQEETRETRIIYEADVIFSDHHTLAFSYEFNDLNEDIAGDTYQYDTRRHEWLLEDRLEFGPGHRHRLNTTLRLQEEDGPLARDLFEFSPRLELRHTDDLTSHASYQFLKERYDATGFESHRGEYTLVHQLFESLTTTANLFGQYEKYEDDLTAYTYGSSLRSSYRKQNRWGVFRAHLGYEWDQRREHGGQQRDVQVRESATFNDPHPIFLAEPYAVVPTIIVTNPERTRVYVPGRDYFATRVRGSVAVHRVRSGDIQDGDSVWISYKYKRRTRLRTDTQRFDARVEQEFKFGLRPYYEFNFRDQNISDPYTGVPFYWQLVEDNLTRHRIGIDYRRDRWSVGVEFESEDNRYDPFDAVHLNGQITVLQNERMTGTVSTNYSRFYFDSPDNRDVDLLDIGFDGQFDFSERLRAQLATAYHWENDSVDGVTHGVDVEAGLVYTVGRTQFELTGEYDLLEIDGSPDDGVGVWLRVRREFGNWIR